jgi:hypothetical protein
MRNALYRYRATCGRVVVVEAEEGNDPVDVHKQ